MGRILSVEYNKFPESSCRKQDPNEEVKTISYYATVAAWIDVKDLFALVDRGASEEEITALMHEIHKEVEDALGPQKIYVEDDTGHWVEYKFEKSKYQKKLEKRNEKEI